MTDYTTIIDCIAGDFARRVTGWPMMPSAAGNLLMEYVEKTEGDYIEIGSAFGGSAIMAGLAMGDRPGTVFCIDPFMGTNEFELDMRLTVFWSNIQNWGIKQRVIAFRHVHPPFPVSIHFHKFSVGLIDGDHHQLAPFRDFIALNDRVTDYLLFDNTEKDAVSETITVASSRGWEIDKVVDYISYDDGERQITGMKKR
ncbi:unnamed protein product [marine sediment metagenome]|uniref:Methyltransferase n=1 Tax=marine sediment metagenome TaxID=412755 RepID=X0TFV2_9ZZZZ